MKCRGVACFSVLKISKDRFGATTVGMDDVAMSIASGNHVSGDFTKTSGK
jgi:hypothetical protein